tara:strand:- start:1042 stop:1725 length:684 start_codon:yes stop_codon:yes gene_type:complete
MRGLHRNLVLLILAFTSLSLFSKEEIPVSITWKGEPFVFDSLYISSQDDTLRLDKFYIYLSSFQVVKKDGEVEREKNSFHLLKYSDSITTATIAWQPSLGILSQDISFNVGIDSVTNTSGALDGDLDPGLGMYWAWHSGYVNFKLEGESSSCNTLKNKFQFHIGGFEFPKKTLRNVVLKDFKQDSKIEVDLSLFFNDVRLSELNSITTVSQDAVKIADLFTKCFQVK